MTPPVLRLERLSVTYPGAPAPAVREVDLEVGEGEVVAIVGNSGSGKSTLLKAVLGLLDPATDLHGTITVAGEPVAPRDEAGSRARRGAVLGYVGQDPYTGMDPVMSVGRNISESWRIKKRPPPTEAIAQRLSDVGVPDAGARTRRRPHTWSGGMLQRACVVAGTALTPALVLADEPTSALDSANARRVIDALRELAGAALLVSHDLSLVADHADRVYRMDAGLLTPVPDVAVERTAWPPRAVPPADPVVRMRGVEHRYPGLTVLSGTDLTVRPGEILGVAGSSGVGKSTLLQLLAGLQRPTAGEISWRSGGSRPDPGSVAMIMQDARGSLQPSWTVTRAVSEPLCRGVFTRPGAEEADRVRAALAQVGLEDLDPDRRTRTLSGGQAQRVAIARALVSGAELLLADEPTSGLDHATADRILGLLRDLADDQRAVVVVSHDDRTLNSYADRVLMLSEPEERT